MRLIEFFCLGLILPAVALAQDTPNFAIADNTLYFDTESGQGDDDINSDHVDQFSVILRANPEVDTLVLNSGGGGVWAGEEMARIVIDYELNTVVDGECSSTCVLIFLGGSARTMTRGSKIGFHSRNWPPAAVEKYYDNVREDEGWETPFEFGSWIYADTQAEVYRDLAYFVERGVDPGFAIEVHAPRERLHYPLRKDLQAAGVLRD